ncbi:MAG: hypothetical protein J2P34_00535 [Actinobacteria bacterium]|nr:hypothetical protein [Actinomycetota bacterium]
MSTSEPAPRPALIAEATKRAGVIWIKAGGSGRPRPAWHRWQDGAAYVLTGPGEQPLPELADGGQVTVLVPSKESRGLLVAWQAEVSRVEPGSPSWRSVFAALAAGRLNGLLRPGPGTSVYRLTPAS